MPAPAEHLTLLTALRRRWSRLTDYERGKVVACEVDAAIGPLDAARVAWMREVLDRLGVDLQAVTGRVLDFGPLPKRR